MRRVAEGHYSRSGRSSQNRGVCGEVARISSPWSGSEGLRRASAIPMSSLPNRNDLGGDGMNEDASAHREWKIITRSKQPSYTSSTTIPPTQIAMPVQ